METVDLVALQRGWVAEQTIFYKELGSQLGQLSCLLAGSVVDILDSLEVPKPLCNNLHQGHVFISVVALRRHRIEELTPLKEGNDVQLNAVVDVLLQHPSLDAVLHLLESLYKCKGLLVIKGSCYLKNADQELVPVST